MIEPLLPIGGGQGKLRPDRRQTINGTLWKPRTGSPWRNLSERYGSWQICHARLVRWQRDGRRGRLLAHVQTKLDTVGEVAWEVSVNYTVIRAHQHASGASKWAPKNRAAPTLPRRDWPRPTTRRSGGAGAG